MFRRGGPAPWGGHNTVEGSQEGGWREYATYSQSGNNGYTYEDCETGELVIVSDTDIVVTSRLTADQADIAYAIARKNVDMFLFIYGAAFGAAGFEVGALLNALGYGGRLGMALIGGASAVNGVTSAADVLAEFRERLIEAVFQDTARDMDENPENYHSWRINPITGGPFDANSPPYNQHD